MKHFKVITPGGRYLAFTFDASDEVEGSYLRVPRFVVVLVCWFCVRVLGWRQWND